MRYNHTVTVDGQTYAPGQEVPDMGSVQVMSVDGNVRNYTFLKQDLDKLPTYDDLGSGSLAVAADASEAYMYEQTTKTWYKL